MNNFIRTTFRYCEGCKKNKLFDFNKVIGHSECRGCGMRFSLPVKVKDEIIKLIESSCATRIKELSRSRKESNISKDKDTITARMREIRVLKELIKAKLETDFKG